MAQYRSATTAASDLLSACVVGMLGRNNEYIEHTPGQISAPARESAVGRHPGLCRGSSCGGLIGRPEAPALFHRDDGVKTLAAAGSLWLPGRWKLLVRLGEHWFVGWLR